MITVREHDQTNTAPHRDGYENVHFESPGEVATHVKLAPRPAGAGISPTPAKTS
jgi:hypothetical protein